MLNSPNKSQTEKKPYRTPRLSHFGSVNELTQSSAFTGNPSTDGGTFPANYNS